MSAPLSAIQTSLAASRFEREQQVLARFPVSRATWWRGVKAGKYPQPVKLSARTTAWRSGDIDALIERVSAAGGQS